MVIFTFSSKMCFPINNMVAVYWTLLPCCTGYSMNRSQKLFLKMNVLEGSDGAPRLTMIFMKNNE